jgi:Protein of unknown function (DUF2934)
LQLIRKAQSRLTAQVKGIHGEETGDEEVSAVGENEGDIPEPGSGALEFMYGDDGDDDEPVRRRAYELSQGEDSGTPEENWLRAEEELRGGSSG